MKLKQGKIYILMVSNTPDRKQRCHGFGFMGRVSPDELNICDIDRWHMYNTNKQEDCGDSYKFYQGTGPMVELFEVTIENFKKLGFELPDNLDSDEKLMGYARERFGHTYK